MTNSKMQIKKTLIYLLFVIFLTACSNNPTDNQQPSNGITEENFYHEFDARFGVWGIKGNAAKWVGLKNDNENPNKSLEQQSPDTIRSYQDRLDIFIKLIDGGRDTTRVIRLRIKNNNNTIITSSSHTSPTAWAHASFDANDMFKIISDSSSISVPNDINKGVEFSGGDTYWSYGEKKVSKDAYVDLHFYRNAYSGLEPKHLYITVGDSSKSQPYTVTYDVLMIGIDSTVKTMWSNVTK